MLSIQIGQIEHIAFLVSCFFKQEYEIQFKKNVLRAYGQGKGFTTFHQTQLRTISQTTSFIRNQPY